MSKHWPGPLTIILKRQPSLRMDLGDAEGTVALRVPDHELARDILRATGPMAVSSANISGLPAALTCDEAIDQLGANVSVYLDGGRLGENGQRPSTIVDFTQADHGQVLRRGVLSVDVLRETLPDLEDLVARRVGRHRRADRGRRGADDVDETDIDVDDADSVPDGRSRPPRSRSRSPRTRPPPTSARGSRTPGTPPRPTAEPWHEPTTDELRITHPDHAVDQPELFGSEQPAGDTPDATGSRSSACGSTCWCCWSPPR